MRVISQDGTFDLPYESVAISRFEHTVYFVNANLTGVEGVNEDVEIAEYSSNEKAIKAMEMLRKQYEMLEVFKVFSCGTAEYIERVLTEEELPRHIKAFYELNVFQFPKDDEVKV